MPKDRGEEKVWKEGRINIKPELLEEVLQEYRGPQDFESIFRQLKKAVLKRALGTELTQHLGYGKGENKPENQTNHRNGSSAIQCSESGGTLHIPKSTVSATVAF